jgi:hypothetical protein
MKIELITISKKTGKTQKFSIKYFKDTFKDTFNDNLFVQCRLNNIIYKRKVSSDVIMSINKLLKEMGL